MESTTVGVLVCAAMLVLAVAVANVAIMWAWASHDMRGSTERKKAYRKIVAMPLLIDVPFLYAGIALITGFAESPAEFFESDSRRDPVIGNKLSGMMGYT